MGSFPKHLLVQPWRWQSQLRLQQQPFPEVPLLQTLIDSFLILLVDRIGTYGRLRRMPSWKDGIPSGKALGKLPMKIIRRQRSSLPDPSRLSTTYSPRRLVSSATSLCRSARARKTRKVGLRIPLQSHLLLRLLFDNRAGGEARATRSYHHEVTRVEEEACWHRGLSGKGSRG